MLVKTVLFDFDGVVVDTERLHLKALSRVLDNHGIGYPRSMLTDFVGRSDSAFSAYAIENLGCSLTTSLARATLLEAGADLVFDNYKHLAEHIQFE
ncbi:MAG: HAD hydrolase-like protein [Paludibacteraceae bacterium]